MGSLKELIEGGFLAQTLLVVLVWGAIVVLAVQHDQIPDPLLDAGFVIIGFYFHTVTAKIAQNRSDEASQ